MAAARRDAARPSVVRSRATSAAAARRDALRPSVVAARNAAANRMMSANQTPARTSTAPLSERKLAAQASIARREAQRLGNQRRAAEANRQAAESMRSAGIRDLTGTPTRGRRPANIRRRPVPRPTTPFPPGTRRTSPSTAAANQEAAESLLGAGFRNVGGDENRSTLPEQIMSGIRNVIGGETLPPTTTPPPPRGPNPDPPRRPQPEPPSTTPTPPPGATPPGVTPDQMPPITSPGFPDSGGRVPSGGMGGGFGYSPDLMRYESQQGAGQVPYYMAAARNAMTPNMSPAFMHAARNYDILGGMQRTRARPIEMMSARERAEIMNMGSNFNTPNYNSPYNQFDYFRNMVGGGGGKGMGRPMPQGMASGMAGGLGAFMGGMGGMF